MQTLWVILVLASEIWDPFPNPRSTSTATEQGAFFSTLWFTPLHPWPTLSMIWSPSPLNCLWNGKMIKVAFLFSPTWQISSCMLVKFEIDVMVRTEIRPSWLLAWNAPVTRSFHSLDWDWLINGSPFLRTLWTMMIDDDRSVSSTRCMI